MKRFNRVLAGTLILPTIFGALVLWSMGDRAEHTHRVPAAVVNLDKPVTTGQGKNEQVVYAGRLLASGLTSPTHTDTGSLGWELADAEDAQAGLANGDYYAVVTIPRDFSRTLSRMSGDDPTRAGITLQTNDASSAVIGEASKQVTAIATDRLGHTITSTYLQGVSEQTGQLKGRLGDAADGAGQARRRDHTSRRWSSSPRRRRLDAGLGTGSAGRRRRPAGGGQPTPGGRDDQAAAGHRSTGRRSRHPVPAYRPAPPPDAEARRRCRAGLPRSRSLHRAREGLGAGLYDEPDGRGHQRTAVRRHDPGGRGRRPQRGPAGLRCSTPRRWCRPAGRRDSPAHRRDRPGGRRRPQARLGHCPAVVGCGPPRRRSRPTRGRCRPGQHRGGPTGRRLGPAGRRHRTAELGVRPPRQRPATGSRGDPDLLEGPGEAAGIGGRRPRGRVRQQPEPRTGQHHRAAALRCSRSRCGSAPSSPTWCDARTPSTTCRALRVVPGSPCSAGSRPC